MWLLYATGSAIFAGLTAILAKVGIRHTPSNLATAIRTVVVLGFAWLMVFVVGSGGTTSRLSTSTWAFLVLSGLATGASWLCYFRALQLADVNQVTPIDRWSIVLSVLFAITLLGETDHLTTRLGGIAIIAVGTWLMIERKPVEGGTPRSWTWLLYAAGSAVFAALTSILGKVGITDVESNLGTAIRTCVVLVMAWLVVFVTREQRALGSIDRRDAVFIVASGFATGASWLCFYHALQNGPASLVVPIDKLSIVVTVAFATLVLHERLSRRAAVGLVLIVGGTLLMLV
ncbi:EamA family transporter [Micropruina glycogenica]|uniref:4-amino-4-deoxy-L-arabinose-phosphoundecaprenol flippase subunit ArnE n=1 Tax=Micropruina glycogenica TaxID=75385 RepID=A0A2N9JK65_9ACTN|nr:EamA family transporter [Micropruina glycogenica]SPD88445.1 4-amino-4-deoxy-L-arabinose-phosphoundecaprenol flippase subunit ArnE [Micropruina glycogenica]